MNAAELRAAIERAHQERDFAGLAGLQAQHRALDPIVRGQLITAERDDQHARRRIVGCSARTVARATRADEPSGQPTLFGHFAVFDVWTEVESFWEGNFMESIGKGAFTKTIENDVERMRSTLNHGRDPQLGNKVLGRIDVLKEDAIGAYYEVGLYRGIDPLVMEGLRDDAYGASFRFYVMAESFVEKPKASAYNPRAIPERTITEAMVEEFGPVTFPQYPEASAHLRSLSRNSSRSIATPAAAGTKRREHSPLRRDEWLRSL